MTNTVVRRARPPRLSPGRNADTLVRCRYCTVTDIVRARDVDEAKHATHSRSAGALPDGHNGFDPVRDGP